MSVINRKSSRLLLCGAVGTVTSMMLSAQSANAQALVYSAFDTYVAGSNSWNGNGQYTTSYHYATDPYGQDVDPLGNPYIDATYGPQYQEPIFDFQLPTLPAGQQLVSAEVTLRVANNGTGIAQNFSADLDALGVGTYAPNNGQFQQTGTLIAPAILTPSSPMYMDIATNASQSTALANFIDGQGYVPFDMVTMRLTPTSDPTGTFYWLGAADWSGMNPVITLTTATVLTWNNSRATPPTDGATWDTTNNNWNNSTSATT